jgi:hypothetical protein
MPTPTRTSRTQCYLHDTRKPLKVPYEPYKYHICLICQFRLLEMAKTDFRFECSQQVVKISIPPELQKKVA